MRKLIRAILLVIISSVASENALAQEVFIPEKYELESKSDYQAHEPTVEKCLIWLLDTPLHEHTETRAEANAFVMQWIAGSPSMTVETRSDLFPFAEKNEELFYTYIHALALYHFENDEVIKGHEDTIFALKEVAKMFRQSKGLKKDDAIKELRRAKRWGNLDGWIEKRLK